MEIKKLHESDELQDRAKKHKKNNKGLSFYCTLNPDAGNVEHNVAMFNHMNTPADSPSVNPCGPMAENVNLREERTMDQIDLHYDDLKVTVVISPQRPSSYQFEYDRDEAQTAEKNIEHDYTVPKSEVVDFIYENMTENDFAEIDTASEDEIVAFINKNFDTLFGKYESMILDYYRKDAREDAEEHMNESLTQKQIAEATCSVEKFVASLGKDLHEAFLSKLIDNNTSEELLRLEALYEKYARVHDDMHTQKIVEKVRSAIASCAENTQSLVESVNGYVIMAVCNDGKKQYYNVSSAPHWVSNGKDATIFDDMDEARAVWFKLDKKSFKRVFIPNYDHETMNEAVDIDKQYQLDMLIDSIEEVMDWKLNKKCKTRPLGNNTYRVVHNSGNTSMIVRFDVSDPVKPMTFMIDKKGPFTAKNEFEAADIILRELQNKHADSFDMFKNEDLSDRIRKNDLEYDDEIDAYLASEGDTQIQFQDREQHTHEFKTKTNQWGRNFVDGQYNKQPKVASHTWGRVWKDGQLVKQAEGPKYQVRAEIAKYLDTEGNIDEDWTPPEDWMSYKGAWIYPVDGGYEANFTGEHFQAATLDELKAKLQAARVHRQKFSGYSERDAKLADKIKSFGREITEDIEDVTRYQMEFYLDGDDTRRTKYIYADSSEEACEKLQAMVGNHSLTAAIPETVPARYKEWDMEEGWSPNLVDCPACGDVSFDSRRGKCTRCTYRESLNTEEDDGHNVGISFDVNAPSDMSEAQIEDIIRKALAPTELLISSYMEIHTLDESVNEALNGYKVTITKNDETFDDYASAYEEENAIQQMINKYGKDIRVTNVQVQKKVNEASYGGAFDIADDQYFTREDLVDCANKVIEHLNETFDDVFEISNVELNGTVFQIEVEGKDLGWYMEKCRIDMRKIRIPSDLTNKYALEFASKFIATIKDYNDL